MLGMATLIASWELNASYQTKDVSWWLCPGMLVLVVLFAIMLSPELSIPHPCVLFLGIMVRLESVTFPVAAKRPMVIFLQL